MADKIKQGINIHKKVNLTNIMGIAVRDLPPDEEIDKYRIDMRKIMDGKRLRKEGFYLDDEQFLKFFKMMSKYNKIVKQRQQEVTIKRYYLK